MKIPSLINAEVNPLCLPGAISFTPVQIRAAHDRVTPIYEASGKVTQLEISPNASTTDICAVLLACGVTVDAIVGDQILDELSRPLRYAIVPAPEIGEHVISLEL